MDFKLRINWQKNSNQELLDDLIRVAKILKQNNVSNHIYPKYGKFSTKIYSNRFWWWNNALKEANLEIVKKALTDEMLFKNLEDIWVKLDRQPYYSEMRKPLSLYTSKAYVNHWGSWTKACEAFIQSKNQNTQFEKIVSKNAMNTRTISEKIRLKILKRDNYACVICWRSPANERGVILHIDHIRPFSKGGDNSIENLQTRCSKCNLGKNNDETV